VSTSVASISTTTLSAGDWVEVRSKEEILTTLERGQLDGLPFMPQMFGFCGQRFQVFQRAHKTCDTVNRTGGRQLDETVHLQGLRCDGAAYGGCDAACLIFWKTAWLKPVAGPSLVQISKARAVARPAGAPSCTEQDVLQATRAPGSDDADPTYVCQATRLPEFTKLLPWWDIRQYAEDYTSGNVDLRTIAEGALYVGYFGLTQLGQRFRGKQTLIKLYDKFQALRGGVPFPRRGGKVPPGVKTPTQVLGLQPGDLVRVKSFEQIRDTLDGANKNRGLFFDAEEVPYCGQVHRVRSRVNQIVDERTGKLIKVLGNTVILEEVYCKGHYSDRRMFCPRAIYSFWRETWLERVTPAADVAHGHAQGAVE
jgi:hypothetical protein